MTSHTHHKVYEKISEKKGFIADDVKTYTRTFTLCGTRHTHAFNL